MWPYFVRIQRAFHHVMTPPTPSHDLEAEWHFYMQIAGIRQLLLEQRHALTSFSSRLWSPSVRRQRFTGQWGKMIISLKTEKEESKHVLYKLFLQILLLHGDMSNTIVGSVSSYTWQTLFLFWNRYLGVFPSLNIHSLQRYQRETEPGRTADSASFLSTQWPQCLPGHTNTESLIWFCVVQTSFIIPEWTHCKSWLMIVICCFGTVVILTSRWLEDVMKVGNERFLTSVQRWRHGEWWNQGAQLSPLWWRLLPVAFCYLSTSSAGSLMGLKS